MTTKKMFPLKNFLAKIVLVLIVVGADQLSKHLLFGVDCPLLGFVSSRATNALNTGGAWGFLGEHMWLLIAFTFVFLFVVIAFEIAIKKTTILHTFAISFVVGGAVGNLIDRIALGGVRDFLFFPFWPTYPTFNVADSFLLVGMILLFVSILFFSNQTREVKKVEK